MGALDPSKVEPLYLYHCYVRLLIFYGTYASIVGLAICGYFAWKLRRVKANAQDLEDIRPHLVETWRKETDRFTDRPRRVLMLIQDMKWCGANLYKGQTIDRYGAFRGIIHSLEQFDS